MFGNSWSFFIKNFTATIWALHTNIFHVKFDGFLAQSTSITTHGSSPTTSSVISVAIFSPLNIFSMF